jgi:hypothetical protein
VIDEAAAGRAAVLVVIVGPALVVGVGADQVVQGVAVGSDLHDEADGGDLFEQAPGCGLVGADQARRGQAGERVSRMPAQITERLGGVGA